MDVAKKKTINLLRRDQLLRRKILPNFQATASWHETFDFSDSIIRDSTLRMIFAACHPSLPPKSQIALALKTLCGLSITEIANALLTNKVAVNKQLYRAKQKFRDKTIRFEIPSEDELSDRLDNVFTTLYLLFNEGYYSPHHEQLIRADLCLEAIRLQKLAMAAFPDSQKAKALLALMVLSFARFESRIDEAGMIVVLEEQDRTLWDTTLIAEGITYLHQSIQGNEVNRYQLQAGIAAEHCVAQDFGATDWQSIYQQYCVLVQLENSAIVNMNKAIARFFCGQQVEALHDMEQLQGKLESSQYAVYQATLGMFFDKLGQKKEAIVHYETALATARSDRERAVIQQKLSAAVQRNALSQ